ncbi:MAG: hypothetical protein KBT03_09470 [Bacteroidales bacterium]|nr:hypothetical protein [Candidatus Scybalousia scybalohippi]
MEFQTKENGAKVVINPCSLFDAFKLKSEIQKALLKNNIKIEEVFEKDIVSLFLALDSSEEIFKCMFACLKKSTYNDIKITEEVFEKEDARGDLYEVFFACLKVNIYPFFKPLLSQLGIQLEIPNVGESLKHE